jgi:peroxiredoxin
VQLQSHLNAYEAAGIGVAVVTYDAPTLQQKFVDKYRITFPMLSDVDATTIRNLGVLDTDYAPGDPAFGIPYPGVFIVDRGGVIVAKVFLKGYERRVDADGVLAAARAALH